MRTPLLTTAALLAALFVPSLGAAAASRAVKPVPAGHVLPWIEDDLTRAMADAKARKLPLFVESWAPW
jgi:ABC-type sugar transport system substrate-binding protein